MKKALLSLFTVALVLIAFISYSQSIMVEIPIIKNGEPITDTLDDGTIVTFDTSSDDAEQENDEMDALYDDDLDAGWEGEPDDQNILTTGLRFQSVPVPKGATVDSAFLVINSHEGKSADDVAIITIVGEANENPETYNLETLITDRPETENAVVWTVAEEWELWEYYRTPDLKTIIQEIIDQDGWVYGNALALMLKGENQGPSDLENAREFESFENIADPEDGGDGQNHPERRPNLLIYYSFPATVFERQILVNGDPITDTLDNGTIVTFDTSSDDAEQENDEMDALYDDDLDAGWEGEPDDQNILTTGLRFRDISIPNGVQIDSAYLVLCSHEGKSAEDVAIITIVGEATDDAMTYDEESLITDRPETNAAIVWEVDEEWELWEFYRTPDIKTIIQEIVDRENWTPGNSLAIMLKGENQGPSDLENAREFESFENIADPEDGGDGQNHPERRPKLVVYYSGGTGFDEFFAHKEMFVYPNPAVNGTFNIVLDEQKEAAIFIYNQMGSLVQSMNSDNQNIINIDVSKLPAGIYHVKAIQDQTVYTQKVLIN